MDPVEIRQSQQFAINVPAGPVDGIVTQNGQRLERWEDVDLGQPWFWAPHPQPQVVGVPWAEGWTEIGYTEEGKTYP
jgi:hypothetical protein